MIGLEPVAEGVSDDFIGHHALVPGVGKAAHAVHAARGFEEGLHADMMTRVEPGGRVRFPGQRSREERQPAGAPGPRHQFEIQ